MSEDKKSFAKFLVSILKGTRNGSTDLQWIAKDAPLLMAVARKKLNKLCKAKSLILEGEHVTASTRQRMSLAIEALKGGADPETVSRYLKWQEFEELAKLALEANQYETVKHLHFSHMNHRWEIDVIGLKEPVILAVDCKHWKKGWQRAATMNLVDEHVERTKSLSKVAFQLRTKLPIHDWSRVEIIPIIITLHEAPFNLYKQVPVVPVLKIANFLYELPANIDALKVIRVKVNKEEI